MDILTLLSSFALLAWSIAAVASFFVQRYYASRGWSFIMVGSLFVVARQAWKFLPAYSEGSESELIFNGYMMRFIFGASGAILLSIGFLLLITNVYIVRSKLETGVK